MGRCHLVRALTLLGLAATLSIGASNAQPINIPPTGKLLPGGNPSPSSSDVLMPNALYHAGTFLLGSNGQVTGNPQNPEALIPAFFKANGYCADGSFLIVMLVPPYGGRVTSTKQPSVPICDINGFVSATMMLWRRDFDARSNALEQRIADLESARSAETVTESSRANADVKN